MQRRMKVRRCMFYRASACAKRAVRWPWPEDEKPGAVTEETSAIKKSPKFAYEE